ncbi:MAG: hypothetical protein F6K63_14495 [Moorea sp. SIO1G6]|uniref:hypothetical protein n=1 Tax=Moorena sp. SIO1G6 TaxID=2607840 RepID=UPI0013C0D575|nr:hypothetical protein [Moorena sp. SIO1G6]NET65524.1 hypothetical protein [Moorena sp. SIO1G6]
MNRSRVGILPDPRDQGTGKMPIPPVAALPTPYGARLLGRVNRPWVAPLPTPFDKCYEQLSQRSHLKPTAS